MAEQLALGFGGLLRQLRAEADLTQEELAEAASLSPRSVSDLERGINRTARKDTAELLAAALDLAEPARSVFVASARGRVPAEEVLAVLRGEAVASEGPGWPGGPYLGLVPFESGTPSCFSDATSWRISWCGGWQSGRTGGDPAGGRGVGVRQVLAAARGVAAAPSGGRAGAGVGAVVAAGDPAHGQPAAGASDAPGRAGRHGSGVGVPVAVRGAG
jgi:transcriptional regulator with XRE-family HTH domain